MANRKRNMQLKFWVSEEERRLIDEKIKQLPVKNCGAYLRKMAIDGYILEIDRTDTKAYISELQAISRNINQIAKRASKTFTMQSPSLHRHCPISTVLWDCPTTYHSFEILRFQLQFHTLLREMAGSPQLMCIHNVKHDWFSDSAVPHNTRHIALHDIVFRTS